jgi:hypothetical protein
VLLQNSILLQSKEMVNHLFTLLLVILNLFQDPSGQIARMFYIAREMPK